MSAASAPKYLCPSDMPYPDQVSRVALIPAGDDKQALRIRRYLMAAGTSLMVMALLG